MRDDDVHITSTITLTLNTLPRRNRLLRETRHPLKRVVLRVEPILPRAVGECPVAELGRVGRGVDFGQGAVGEGDLVGSFGEVGYSFEVGAAGRGCPEV